MLKRERIINILHELEYKFKRDTPRGSIWRNGTHAVFLPKTAKVSETWLRATLQTCGCKPSDIDEFVRAAKL